MKPPSGQKDEASPLRRVVAACLLGRAVTARLLRRALGARQPLRAMAARQLQSKRTALLVPVLVALFFVAVAERGHPASGKASASPGGSHGTLMAALTDPLSLFADRSPGGRGAGPLLSTKPQRTAALAPEERVLSGIRDRDPGAGAAPLPPALDDPLFAAAAPGGGGGIPGAGSSPGEAGLPGGGGFPGGGGPGGGGPGGGGPDAFAPFGQPFVAGAEPPEFIPGGAGGPDGPGAPGGPGGVFPPGGTPGVPIASGVPEPATWAMLILGFFAVGAAMRRRARKRAGPAFLS
jgi:hypothetical protein